MQRPAKPFTPVRFRLQPPLDMKIAIIGYGFVGRALENALIDEVEILKVDPKLDVNINKDLKSFNPNVVFICAPSPMSSDGSINFSIINKIISDLIEIKFSNLLVIKSTIHPDCIKEAQQHFPNLIYNPEFLREKSANDDFINANLIVIGGTKKESKKLGNIYKNFTKCVNKDYVYTDAYAASLIKYSINSFLATKVIFFNELKNLFDLSDTNESWDNFISFLSLDKRLGDSHMDVPGHDGRLGFGGACFPKDTKAIIKYAEDKRIDLKLIKSAVETNNRIRASYKKNIDRENDQSIDFNIKDD